MTVTNDYDGNTPTVDADEDTWGAENNTALGQIYTTLESLVGAVNGLLTDIAGALLKAGGTMTGDVVLADVGPSSIRSVGFRGAPVVNFDADKTLAITDAGKTQRLTGSSGRSLTIPPVSAVGFPVGTVIPLRSSPTAAISVVRGSGVTLKIAGSSTNKNCTVAAEGIGSLLHEDTNVWVLSGVGVG